MSEPGHAADYSAISARPLLIATTSRSTTRERKLTTGPSRHISVRMVSPGNTGAENRAGDRGQLRRVVAAEALEQRVAGDAVGREPVQDRAREARGLRHRRVGVQRIGVGAEPVDQRHLRPGRQVADEIGRALRDRMRRRLLARRAAEAAVGAAERRVSDRRDARAGRLVVDGALGIEHRALALALVDDLGDAGLADHGAARA